MKRLCIAIIILATAFVSCKKVSGPADGKSIQPNNNRDSMVALSAMVNGQKYKTDSAFAYLIKSSGNDSLASGLMINAVEKDSATHASRTININITRFTGPATYQINPPYNTATYYVGTMRNFATSGQIIITSDTAYSLTGTFNFIANADTISGGTLNVAMP